MREEFFLYTLVVWLYSQVFQSVGAPIERAWYLAITEWVILSSPPLALQLENDIRSGQIAYFMLRPLHYLKLRFLECAGVVIVRYWMLAVLCLLLGFSLTGHFPGTWMTWLLGSGISLLSILLYVIILMIIGLLAFWLKDIRTTLYLNLTATFCFGGLIVPLDFYSETFRNLCFTTPYPWILWWPAQTITGADLNQSAAFLNWGIWFFILTGCTLVLYQHCTRVLVTEGG